MTTLHQAYLQACLHRQLFTDDEAFTLYQRLCELHQMTASREAMYTFFGELNRSIFKFDLELRRMTDEDTGIPMWSLVNTNGDDIAQQATKYTARELKYMKKLIHMIAGADNELFSVSAITALNESPDHLSKVETEALLTSFVKDGWLTLTEGYYGLGVRCLMELASYLKERFQMPECNICMDMITKGERCDSVLCAARLHYHCSRRYFQYRTEKTCPLCHIPWTGQRHIGPMAMIYRS